MWTDALITLVGLTIAIGGATGDVMDTEVTLEMEDECWFYTSDDPALSCTVYSLEGSIIWKQDAMPIAIGGATIGQTRSLYNVSSYVSENSTSRIERLQVYANLTLLAGQAGSQFWCENLGYSSPHVSLAIPDCSTCQSCVTTIAVRVNVTAADVKSTSGSTAATVVVAATFGVAVLVMIVIACIYLCSRERHKKEQESPKQLCPSEPGSATGSFLTVTDLDQSFTYTTPQSLAQRYLDTRAKQDKSVSLPLLPVAINQMENTGTPRTSTKSMSKVEYLKPDYKLTKYPSYRSPGGGLLPSKTLRSPAPKAILEVDDL